ncbi:formate/nitrite transporter family protein [Geosporobacter ferrireducens]|uniref:FdhC protein n=1 Tax=Geosporobacter ferrireducens TaxID=1424294 RepID=A0A1D8GLQ2_9FIRM|nr:formate/nitrite transporter family protein [Geosporobacter ferrireducens]AOT71762.1 FdhC protein [Geosporobacter ferrireducens]MTI55548.1 formate/nitrite transporter family protein [Geosporobacter ferrireducens]
MEKRMLVPKEIAEATVAAGIGKSKLSILQMSVLSIFAGAFIAFGAQGAIVISQTLASVDAGLAKFAFAATFPIGLMMVVICGAELFTGNNLMTLGVLDGKCSFSCVLKNWITVYLGNFIGSILTVIMIYYSGLMSGPVVEKAIAIATAKMAIPLGSVIIRGILCNIIVVLAVWMATGAKDVISKLFACWFPVMLFVLSGYEHSIANMYFIPMAKFLGADISWSQMWLNNIIPATIGNLIGGALIVPLFYYLAYLRPIRAAAPVPSSALQPKTPVKNI